MIEQGAECIFPSPEERQRSRDISDAALDPLGICPRRCACGCGERVARRFLRGHNKGRLRPLVSRFLSRISDHLEPNGCRLWLGPFNRDGYGRIFDGETTTAHRVAYKLAHGEIPAGLMVLHSCDNPPCINADHLRLGTALDNVADMVTRGRQRHTAKLTVDDVRAIRRSDATAVSLAVIYGVSDRTIGFVRSRARWAHVI